MRFLKARMPRGYDEQTYASPYWFVRIPHEMRYRRAVKAIGNSRRVLDYGAGDGKLLADLTEREIVAYEPVREFRDKINVPGVQVVGERAELTGPFDIIVCLGVLEHMPLPERMAFYDLCDQTLAPEGTIFIDVPVEIGPALLVKAITRTLLKGRNREYGTWELLRLTAGGVAFDPARYDPATTSTWIHDHKGFDYRLFRKELAARFQIIGEQRTPVPWLPAPFGNQEVYFHARARRRLRDDLR